MGDNVSMSTSNQVLTRLQELLAPLGAIHPDQDDDKIFDVIKSDNVGVGVEIKNTSAGVKLEVIIAQEHVTGMLIGLGRKGLSRNFFSVRVRDNGTFKLMKFYNEHGEKLVAWEPTELADEALMQKAAALVAKVFARN